VITGPVTDRPDGWGDHDGMFKPGAVLESSLPNYLQRRRQHHPFYFTTKSKAKRVQISDSLWPARGFVDEAHGLVEEARGLVEKGSQQPRVIASQ
jgi:hypothetical protein